MMIDRSQHFKWPHVDFAAVVGGDSPHWTQTGERTMIGDAVPEEQVLKVWSERELAKHGITIGDQYSKPPHDQPTAPSGGQALRLANGELRRRHAVYTMAEVTHAGVERAIIEMAQEVARLHGPGRLFPVGGEYWPFGYLKKKSSVGGLLDLRRMCVEPRCSDQCADGVPHRFDSEPRAVMGGYFVHIPNAENQVI